MSTRTANKPLTAQDLEAGYVNDEWLGYGYLGGRRSFYGEPGSSEAIALADQAVLAAANAKGWTPQELFTWANSKLGRWYADETLGSPANDVDAIAAKYVKRPY
jgi:hypothetical protein